MSPGRSTGKGSAATRHSLQLAAAAAQEAVVQLHVERASRLIHEAAGRVGMSRMLDIYVRMQSLTGTTAEVVRTRVLAAMAPAAGDAAGPRRSGPREVQPPETVEDESLLRTLRRRLRGRIHDDLRRVVELQTGVTQTMLLETHVNHARNFVRILAETQGISAACSLYVEYVTMPPHLAGVLYTLVLNRIAADEMPRAWAAAAPPALPPAAEAATRREPRPHRARRPA